MKPSLFAAAQMLMLADVEAKYVQPMLFDVHRIIIHVDSLLLSHSMCNQTKVLLV